MRLGSIPRSPSALSPLGSNPIGWWIGFDPKACAKPMRKALLIGFDPKRLSASLRSKPKIERHWVDPSGILYRIKKFGENICSAKKTFNTNDSQLVPHVSTELAQ